jgi:hypothetical protein
MKPPRCSSAVKRRIPISNQLDLEDTVVIQIDVPQGIHSPDRLSRAEAGDW